MGLVGLVVGYRLVEMEGVAGGVGRRVEKIGSGGLGLGFDFALFVSRCLGEFVVVSVVGVYFYGYEVGYYREV